MYKEIGGKVLGSGKENEESEDMKSINNTCKEKSETLSRVAAAKLADSLASCYRMLDSLGLRSIKLDSAFARFDKS